MKLFHNFPTLFLRLVCRISAIGPSFVVAASLAIASPTTGNAQSVKQIRDRVNQGTVGVMCGRTSASFLYFCEDIAAVLNDEIGYSLRVIPMIGSGAVRNVEDVLYLKGVDLAMTFADTLDFMEKQGVHPNIKKKVRYVTRLWDTELHIVARKEFKSLYDLDGQKVNFSSIGSGTYLTMTNLFEAHGLTVDVQSDKKSIARERLKKGEIAAMASNSAVPWPFAEGFDKDDEVHLLDIPPEWVLDGYETSSWTSDIYPNLIAPGETVRTLRNPAVLLAYNWDQDNPRCAKVQRFVSALNKRFPELRSALASDQMAGCRYASRCETSGAMGQGLLTGFGKHHSDVSSAGNGMTAYAFVFASALAFSLQSAQAAEFISTHDGKLSGEIILSTESTVTIRPDGGSIIMLAYDDIKLVRYTLGNGSIVEGELHEWRDGTYVLKQSDEVISIKDGAVLSEDMALPLEGRHEQDGKIDVGGGGTEAGEPSPLAYDTELGGGIFELKATAGVTSEEAKELIVDISSSRPRADDVIILFTTLNGTAEAGSDFTSKNGIIRLPAGETNVQLVIPLVDDDEAEDDEELTVLLSSNNDIKITPSRDIVATIKDND